MANEGAPVEQLSSEAHDYISQVLIQAQDRWKRLIRRDPETSVAWDNVLGTLFGGTAQELVGAHQPIPELCHQTMSQVHCPKQHWSLDLS